MCVGNRELFPGEGRPLYVHSGSEGLPDRAQRLGASIGALLPEMHFCADLNWWCVCVRVRVRVRVCIGGWGWN